jgi:hypothetical protein
MGEEHSTKEWDVDCIHVAHVKVTVDSSVNARVHYPVPEMVWKFYEQVGCRKLTRTLLSEVV